MLPPLNAIVALVVLVSQPLRSTSKLVAPATAPTVFRALVMTTGRTTVDPLLTATVQVSASTLPLMVMVPLAAWAVGAKPMAATTATSAVESRVLIIAVFLRECWVWYWFALLVEAGSYLDAAACSATWRVLQNVFRSPRAKCQPRIPSWPMQRKQPACQTG